MVQRILVKLSGESLATADSVLDSWPAFKGLEKHPSFGAMPSLGWTNSRMVLKTALDIKAAHSAGLQIALVVGGGNLCRGRAFHPSLRTDFDKIGMLATVMNGLLLQAALKVVDVPVLIMSTQSMPAVCELYTADRARKALSEGFVAICAGGSGLPFFSTDTAAVIRACELECDRLLKATKVNGAYSADPVQHPEAVFYPELSYDEFLKRKLTIMDSTAVSIAQSQNLVIDIANTYEADLIVRSAREELTRTRLSPRPR